MNGVPLLFAYCILCIAGALNPEYFSIINTSGEGVLFILALCAEANILINRFFGSKDIA